MNQLTNAPAVETIERYRVPRHSAATDLDLSGTELPPLDALALATALADSAAQGWRYPNATEFEAELANRVGVGPSRVIVGAGSDDLLERAFRATLTSEREVILTNPTFEMLPRYAALAGATIRTVDWPDGELPVAGIMTAATPATALIAIVSPNNPTGTAASTADLIELARRYPDVLLLIDGAYAEFADNDPLDQLIREPNILTTRTASKAWGLAGLRIGTGYGPEAVVEAMRRAGTPYPISTPALIAARTIITRDRNAMRRRVAAIRTGRDRLTADATRLGLVPTHSKANFICTATPRAPWLRDGMAGLGVAVRWLPGEPARVRITCPAREAEVERVERALQTVLDPEVILLDMDGVIADVSRSFRQAIIATAARFGVTLSPAGVAERKSLGNANDDWMLTHELIIARGGVASLEEVTSAFEALYQGTASTPGLWQEESLLGARCILEQLAASLPLAIVTGRPRRDAERFLEQQQIDGLFNTVICREDAPLKPSPAPVFAALKQLGATRAWMVGDTPDDIQAARAAGVVPIGMIPPGESPDALTASLSRSGAARVIRSLEELLPCLP